MKIEKILFYLLIFYIFIKIVNYIFNCECKYGNNFEEMKNEEQQEQQEEQQEEQEEQEEQQEQQEEQEEQEEKKKF